MNRDIKSLSITLSGAFLGFSVSPLLWSLCEAFGVNSLVPELISDAVDLVALTVVFVRARRVMKR